MVMIRNAWLSWEVSRIFSPKKLRAEKWIRATLWYACGFNPIPQMYFCNKEFKGTIFVRFGNMGDRDSAIRVLKGIGFEEGSRQVMAKPDEDCKVRVKKNLGLGPVWYLGKTQEGTVPMGNAMVLEAGVDGKELNLNFGPNWESYLNDSNHPQFTELVASLKAKLTTANSPTKGLGKAGGKGKGKSKFKFDTQDGGQAGR